MIGAARPSGDMLMTHSRATRCARRCGISDSVKFAREGRPEMKPASVISGLYETHLLVADLRRSMHFYGEVLGLQLAVRDERRALAFYWIGSPGQAFVGLWQKSPSEIARQHFAFEVALEDLACGITLLTAQGVAVKNFFDEPTDVPSVFGWMPAASIYFDDPDGHLLELLARLPGPPQPERGILSLPEWLGH
jgi:catechol 2,3-dioxygenase-like lactoylglutathione lyase family enzyme